MSMKNAVAIVREAGYELEQVPELKGATWKKMVRECPDKKTRDYLQSLRWTGGDVKKLYAAREKQREAYAARKK